MHVKRPATAIFLSILMSASLASAQTEAPDAEACENAANQATMTACAVNDHEAADAALNEAYNEVEKRLAGEKEVRHRLIDAQRAWIAFRDAECRFTTMQTEGGSVHPMVQANCLETLTRARTEQIESLLACEEGDMSCPVPAEGQSN